jgi:hypothetical protein
VTEFFSLTTRALLGIWNNYGTSTSVICTEQFKDVAIADLTIGLEPVLFVLLFVEFSKRLLYATSLAKLKGLCIHG